jgi:DNA-binding Xre family transcriptional regulator
MSSIRWRLREIAEPERWNPNKLAETTGLAYHTVWAIWHNKAKRADLATLATLATTLKVKPGDLLALEVASKRLKQHTG